MMIIIMIIMITVVIIITINGDDDDENIIVYTWNMKTWVPLSPLHWEALLLSLKIFVWSWWYICSNTGWYWSDYVIFVWSCWFFVRYAWIWSLSDWQGWYFWVGWNIYICQRDVCVLSFRQDLPLWPGVLESIFVDNICRYFFWYLATNTWMTYWET